MEADWLRRPDCLPKEHPIVPTYIGQAANRMPNDDVGMQQHSTKLRSQSEKFSDTSLPSQSSAVASFSPFFGKTEGVAPNNARATIKAGPMA